MKNTYYAVFPWIACLAFSLYFNIGYKSILISRGYSLSAAEKAYKDLSAMIFGAMIILLLVALLALNVVGARIMARHPNIKNMDDFLNRISLKKIKADGIKIISIYLAISSMFGAELGFVLSLWVNRSH